MKPNQNGFIALVSAIIIALLLLTITVGVSFSGIFGRLNIVDSESKERSSALAEACVNKAILNLAQNQAQPVAPINIGPTSFDNCSIVSVIANGTQTTIKTQAVINKSYTNLQITVDSDTFTIISWNELPNF